jgi:signal transduction histidine kinase
MRPLLGRDGVSEALLLEDSMKRTNTPMLQLVVIGAIAGAVLILGILQYRWTSEISGAEQERLKSALGTSVRNFNQQFAYDFERLGESFEIDPEAPASTIEARVLRQYSNWTRTTSRRDLVAGLDVWAADDNRALHLESLDSEKKQFQDGSWPKQLESLQPLLEKQFAQLPPVISGHDATYYPWTFYGEDAPALVRPLFQISSEGGDSDMQVQPVGFLIIEINGDFLKGSYLPELVDHDFGPSGFRVAVRSADLPYRAIYLSDPAFPIATPSPDAEINLFNSVGEEARRRGHAPVEPSDAARQWQLVAQHPSGSLEAAVVRWRQRDLAISLGLLGILAGSAVLIFSVARRAERLAKFQMEFVAGVSHELCTPLAVINSAVENLADGVVDHPAQVQEYAGILRDQSGRLERLMDQVLLLASGQFDRSQSELRPTQVAAIVEESIALLEPTLRETGFAIEKEIPLNLPPVMADPIAVSKCVDNLISNAMKYGGANRWIAVRARTAQERSQSEVQISVEDKGIGISAADMESIFEPFYRARAVREGQMRGVGLGLYLVKRMIEGMGGRVSVSSEIGRGSCFVLHLPVPASDERQQRTFLSESWLRRSFESLSTSISRLSAAVHSHR